MAYGLIAAFFGEIMIDKGRVQETNFDSYRIMRLKETPKIEAVIVPAVINAVFATGGGKLC